MVATQKNYSLFNIGTFAALGEKEIAGAKGRIMLGAALGLTGSEISVNSLPPGKSLPFAHSHKLNEEVYLVIGGKGLYYVDGEEFAIQEGSAIRVAPEGKRAIKAGETVLTYICIQTQRGSLTQASMEDGIVNEEKASWM
jgi:uncharacterized cupin superfamily protein